MSEITIADVELKMGNMLEQWTEKVADRCVEKIKNAQHDCEAFRIFRDKENVKDFYKTKEMLQTHIEIHKKKESTVKWLIGLLVSVFLGLIGLIIKLWK